MLAQTETVFRLLQSLDDIEVVADEWRRLEDCCADPLVYFQSYDWCRNWIARFGQDGKHQAHIASLWRGDRMVAVWPLVVVHGGGMCRLMTLGAPHSQYCGMLAEPGVHAERDLVPMMQAALDRSGCDVAVFRAVPEASLLSKVLGDMTVVPDGGDSASMLDLSAYASAEAYTAQLGKLQKRNRNRRRNHLARHGELQFSVIWPDDPDFANLVARCAAMKRQWLAEMQLYSAGFAMVDFDAFLSSLGGDSATKSGACVSVLRVGNEPVAIELGFIRQGHYYAYMGGFDWALRNLSPGKVQMDMTVCWLIDQGIATYDLLTNSADYKKSWSTRSLTVTCQARALTWKGEIYASAWLPRVRPALKRLRNGMPDLVHAVSGLLRSSLPLLLCV